ncbi:MAG TPA: hypothetical protein VJA40_04685 [archaeon]|nr:hypothetical protein [archaeon]
MDESIFLKMFGDTPFIRVVDFFLDNDSFDYSKSDIARESGVSRVTLDSVISRLLKLGVIKQTRVAGKSQMFQLNRANPAAQRLLELDVNLSIDYSSGKFNDKPSPQARMA